MNNYMSTYGKRPSYGEGSDEYQFGLIQEGIMAARKKWDIGKNLMSDDIMNEAADEAAKETLRKKANELMTEAAKEGEYQQGRLGYMQRPKIGEQTQDEMVRDRMRTKSEGFHEYMKTMYSLTLPESEKMKGFMAVPEAVTNENEGYIKWLKEHGFDRYGNSIKKRQEIQRNPQNLRPYKRDEKTGIAIENPDYTPKRTKRNSPGFYDFEYEL